MVDFSGWYMPVQYEGILAEHEHTRTAVSLFDCSHMGQFRLRGEQAGDALDTFLPRRAGSQKVGTCRYNFLLNDDGGVVDDIIVYRLADDEFMIVVNAGTQDGDADYIRARLPDGVAFANESAQTAKIDLQGPLALDVMAGLGFDRDALPRYFRAQQTELNGMPALLSRTGYTGECGFEFYIDAEHARDAWELLLAQPQVKPAGLGARDTLRLEMAYPLYGHELDTETTPVEAGFKSMLHFKNARPFPGRDKLLAAPARELVGLRLAGRRAARAHAPVRDQAGNEIGRVTSGSFAPSLGVAIALAYVPAGRVSTGDTLRVGPEKRALDAEVCDLPFYTEGSARQ